MYALGRGFTTRMLTANCQFLSLSTYLFTYLLSYLSIHVPFHFYVFTICEQMYMYALVWHVKILYARFVKMSAKVSV